MSEQISLARPYAKAIFELARDSGDYSLWSDQLEFLATVAADPAMKEIIQNPEITEQQLTDLILDVGKDQLNEQTQNLVKLLVHNDRLAAANDINRQYLVLRDEAEQVIEAQLITASEVDDAQKRSIETALSGRLGKKIKLETSVDESLIGGAVVRAGDWVVDGSVKAQLQDLVGAIGS
jgi:F-type H+-transporting ATPase subunit delta